MAAARKGHGSDKPAVSQKIRLRRRTGWEQSMRFQVPSDALCGIGGIVLCAASLSTSSLPFSEMPPIHTNTKNSHSDAGYEVLAERISAKVKQKRQSRHHVGIRTHKLAVILAILSRRWMTGACSSSVLRHHCASGLPFALS